MCDGSCDQIRAERERKQLEWEAMPQAEKDRTTRARRREAERGAGMHPQVNRSVKRVP